MQWKERHLHSYQKQYFVFTEISLKARFSIFYSFFCKITLDQIYLHNSILLLKIGKKHFRFV